MITKYLKQASSSEIVNVPLFKLFYILENIMLQNDYLIYVTVLPFFNIPFG